MARERNIARHDPAGAAAGFLRGGHFPRGNFNSLSSMMIILLAMSCAYIIVVGRPLKKPGSKNSFGSQQSARMTTCPFSPVAVCVARWSRGGGLYVVWL
jgi:hypothetical protein